MKTIKTVFAIAAAALLLAAGILSRKNANRWNAFSKYGINAIPGKVNARRIFVA